MNNPKQFRKHPQVKAILYTFIVAALIFTTPPSVPVANGQQTAARKEAAGSKVSAEAITRHVTFLASDKLQGRRAGTPQADEAAKYIAGEFKKAGLKPVDGKSFLEDFSFISGVKLGTKNSFDFHALSFVATPAS